MEEYEIEKLLEFIEKNSSLFTPFEKTYLKSYICTGEYKKILFLPDLVREVVDELGFLLPNQDIYTGFVDLVRDSFDLNGRSIIEIGGGIFPRVAERLINIPGVKNVVVYDPRINYLRPDTDRFKVIRRRVDYNEPDLGGDLLVGFKPCKGAEVIVKQAINYNHDFIVALCEGGLHGDCYDYFENEDEWLSSIMREAELGIEKNNMGVLKVKSLKQYGDRYPVIYNERK